MKKKPFYILATLLLIGGGVSAQEMLTLEEYQQKVVDYSQSLKQARENVAASVAKRKADKTGFLPKIDMAAYGTIDFTNLDLWDAPVGIYHPYKYFAGATMTQSIWAGGALQDQYRADKISEKISQEQELLTMDNIYLQADQIYWLAAANNDYLRIARQYHDIIRSQYEIIKLRFEEGSIAKNDLLMITTRLKEAELGQKKAEVSYLLAYQNMNILMGINPNGPKEPTEVITKAIPTPMEISFDEALSKRADYKIADLNLSLAKENRDLALSKFNPNLAFQVQGGWGTADPNLGAKPTWVTLGTLSVSMPLWHWGERKQVNRQFRALQNSALYNRQIVSDQISKEVANAWTSMDQSFEQIRVAEENLKLAQEALDLNTYSYNEGKITIADVLSSQLSWIQAYTNMISAHYSYKVAVAQYKKAVGIIVPEN